MDGTTGGTVTAVSRSATHTFTKPTRDAIRLVAGLGVENDAHAVALLNHVAGDDRAVGVLNHHAVPQMVVQVVARHAQVEAIGA